MKPRFDPAAIILVVLVAAGAFVAGALTTDAVLDRAVAPAVAPPPPAPVTAGPLGLPSGYDAEAERLYEARIAAQDTALREREAETVALRRQADAAERAAEALRQQTVDAFEEQLDAAAHVGDDVIEAAEAVDLTALSVAWQRRLAATQDVARKAEARAEAEQRLAAVLRLENESLRLEVDMLTAAVDTARERVDYLSQPRLRWGPGATVGVQPHATGAGPTVVVGFSVSWS